MCESLIWRKAPTAAGWWWYRYPSSRHVVKPIQVRSERLHSNAPPIPLYIFDEHGRYAPGVTLAEQMKAEWAGPIEHPGIWTPGDPEAV